MSTVRSSSACACRAARAAASRTKTFSISAISSSASPLTRVLRSRKCRRSSRSTVSFPKPPRVSRSSMARAAGAASRKRAQGRGGGPAVPVAAGAAMEEFRRGYARLCAAPQEPVLRRLRELGGARGRLDLAAQGLSLETCGALARLLPGAAPVTELALGDCGLSEEGAKLLLHGLCSNTTVKALDLKGNNLRTVGAEALGKLLRQNKSIRSLILEWNSLGVWEEGFSFFCQGLGANSSLQRLDLRNNQINHQGAGELAMALKHNSSLQELDLRWNNIGLLGGRALLNCLHSNKTLKRLELAGNNVPSDILKAVEQAMDHNQERETILSETQNRTHILSKEVLSLKDEKTRQFLDLMDTIDKQREEIARSGRMSATQVSQLQEALDEQHSIMNSLKAKYGGEKPCPVLVRAVWAVLSRAVGNGDDLVEQLPYCLT